MSGVATSPSDKCHTQRRFTFPCEYQELQPRRQINATPRVGLPLLASIRSCNLAVIQMPHPEKVHLSLRVSGVEPRRQTNGTPRVGLPPLATIRSCNFAFRQMPHPHWKIFLGRIDFCVESYRVIESSRIKYLQDSRPESFWYNSTIHETRWKFSRWKNEYINELYYIIFDKDGKKYI